MRRAIVVISLIALVLAGCGGSKKSNRASAYKAPQTAAAGGSSGQADAEDADAKIAARNLVTEVEVCFADQQDYTGCKKPAGTKAAIGSGPGQVEVTSADMATYTIVAHSQSGTNFTIAKDASGMKQTCDKPNAGGCKSGGTW